jgi:hypothetical protein
LAGLYRYRAQPKWANFGRNSFFSGEIQNSGDMSMMCYFASLKN